LAFFQQRECSIYFFFSIYKPICTIDIIYLKILIKKTKNSYYIENKLIIIIMEKAALVLVILMGIFFLAAIVCIVGGIIGASGIAALFS